MKSIIILLLLVFLSNGYNYVYWDISIARRFYLILGIIIFLISLSAKDIKLRYSHIYILLFLEPLLSIITVLTYDKGFANDNIYNLSLAPLYLLPYVYKKYHFENSEIINGVIYFALIGFVIQIIQLLFPSSAVFGISHEMNSLGDYVEIRNGINRYRLDIYFESMLCLFFYWNKYIKQGKTFYLIFVFIFLFSIYIYLSRQLIFVSIFGLVFSYFFIYRKKVTFWVNILIIVSVFLVLHYSSVLFDFFVEQTTTDLTEDYVRFEALYFYWDKIISNPLSLIIGSGMPTDLYMWKIAYLYTPSDIGFVGEMFYFGLLWVLLYVYILYICLYKNRAITPSFVVIFLISSFMSCYQVFPYLFNHPDTHVLWISLLYIALETSKESKKVNVSHSMNYENRI